MARESRQVWEKRVQRLHESELKDAEFAREIGVNLTTLRKWKWKLKTEQRQVGDASGLAKRGESRGPKPTFLEMSVAPAAPASDWLELRVGGVEVRVPVGFDEATLSRVVALLRSA